MKRNAFLLVLLLLAVSHSEKFFTSSKTTAYIKGSCDPALMRGLSQPSSQIPNSQAFKSLLETIKNSTNPSQVLYNLTRYTPKFVGLFLTYIQQINLLRKRVKAADSAIRERCMAGYQVKRCV
jgi:hypothetical protein